MTNTPGRRVTPNSRVVVGVDGSDSSLRALDQAVEAARRHGARLEIVHGRLPEGHDASAPFDAVDTVLEQAATRARELAPELDVVTEARADDAATALVEQGRHARLTVVGTRGHGGFAGLLLGSVSLRVAAHTESPLLVARGDQDVARTALGYDRVLLGVESDADTPAAAFAFEEAALRKARLRVLHAWTLRQPRPTEETRDDFSQRARTEESVPGFVTARLRELHPEVAVDLDSVHGAPARALVEESVTADLVVIAAHRRKSRLGLQLGPVTHALLHHAHCPVVLVPVAA
ncbi:MULTISPECIES: universal stress protein [unclassified Streptomyces]|uniref:universal stress protein n=1 Tax=unclassified Streptomyces TaxID=2593676 RepID=UPI002473BE7A|nr:MULTISPECIES: universal stress protein [unclassified Streptomyces]MDH6447669.1 nucleotide-binding universal stress UspA family protein [Streptomyces sp. SAI-119]MDH6501608.1 nucleotide-binding universal stress UspA family protein [Streptomyces sp. SAI-149]